MLVFSLTTEPGKMALLSADIPLQCKHSLKPASQMPKLAPISSFSPILLSRAHPKPAIHISLRNPPLSSLFIKPNKTHHAKFTSPTIRSLFTGIVEEMGTIKHLGFNQNDSFNMKIQGEIVLQGIHLGDSISVNGTCLTVTQFNESLSEFSVGLSPETLRKTSLGELKSGSLVNLERAVSPSSRMGGHFVQGHVDGTGEIVEFAPEGDSLWVKLRTGKELMKYIVPKGFIAVDGASLTVVDVFDDELCFNFMLVAYTQQKIVIPLKKVGQKVNLELDILGKYVERLLANGLVDSVKLKL